MAGGAVLIGSGPSLNAIDCRRLASLPTIAFNRSWIAWRDWGFEPRWYACLDDDTVAAMADDFPALLAFRRVERYFLHPAAREHVPTDDSRAAFVEPADAAFRAWHGEGGIGDFGNVGATSLQILCGLGMTRVLMVGVDGRYVPRAAEEPDANHFLADYNVEPVTADYERYIRGWPAALAGAAGCGMDVRNASPGSAVNGCPAIDFDRGLAWLVRPD